MIVAPVAFATGVPVALTSATLVSTPGDDTPVAMQVTCVRCAVTQLIVPPPSVVLLAAIASVARGEVPVSRSERYRLIDTWRRWQASADATIGSFEHLTQREAQVLAQLMMGHSVKVIANRSQVALATVRTQVRGILTKLDVGSQLEAVALALRSGWQPPPAKDGLVGGAGVGGPDRLGALRTTPGAHDLPAP